MISKFSLGLAASFLFLLVACKQKEQSSCDCEKLRIPTSRLVATGAKTELLQGEDAGFSLDSLPGVKTITTSELIKLKDFPGTGLYLLDTDFVPQELAESLKEQGYTLHMDGTLDSAGVKKTIFVQAEVYRLTALRTKI